MAPCLCPSTLLCSGCVFGAVIYAALRATSLTQSWTITFPRGWKIPVKNGGFFSFLNPSFKPDVSVENCLESCFSFLFFFSPSKMLLCNIPETGQHSRLQRKSGWISDLCRKAGKVQNTHAHIFVWLWGGTKSFGRWFERVGSVVLSYQMCCLWNQTEGTASVLLTDIVRGTALAPNKHSAEETDDLHICLRRPVCLLPFRPFLCAAEQTLPH